MKQMAESKNQYRKPDVLAYTLARLAAWPLAHFVFQRRVLRNEIRRKSGGFVVIANHECALDFVNLIGLCPRRMTFVISRSFYSTLPLQRIFDRIGVLPKQQFQTELADLKRMKAVVSAGEPLVLYPAGLMCEDGRSTPIPQGTWSLFRLLNVDIYMARTTGAYHVMPKWSKHLRPGRTYMDVYRLFTREELHSLSKEEIRRRTEEALSFDAYAEQDRLRIPYHRGDNVEGLEQVVYQCPDCRRKYTIRAKGNTLRCDSCGFSASADSYGFLYSASNIPRYISQWNRDILRSLEEDLPNRTSFSLPCTIHTIDKTHHRFRETGRGMAVLTPQELSLVGQNKGESLVICQSVISFPSLPFSPGHYFEIQNGREIYRCYPEEGKYVMEFINTLKLWHQHGQKATLRYKGENLP